MGNSVGVVVLDPQILEATSPRRRALFAAGVRALRGAYEARGGVLLVREGVPSTILSDLARSLGATSAHALRSYTPYGRARDEKCAEVLRDAGVSTVWHPGLYVHEPGTLRRADGGHFSVYSPYSRRWFEEGLPTPLPSPDRLDPPDAAREIDLGEIPDWTSDVPLPELSEERALARLEEWVEGGLSEYASDRNRLDGRGVSRLSIELTLGVLSSRQAAWSALDQTGEGSRKWLQELAWRDFLADVLLHRPDLLQEPFDPRWSTFPWEEDEEVFVAWREGRTGIPVVDAAMRELRETGWISNRARMVTAQFLTKHLRIHWRRGERLFHEWLLDGDTASNVGNWQWAAGLGLDNAPYFRVLNPVLQGKAHDPEGGWLRTWVPESGGSPAPLPHAIVDLAEARKVYLAATEEIP